MDPWTAVPYDIGGNTHSFFSLLIFCFPFHGKIGFAFETNLRHRIKPRTTKNNNGRRRGFDVRVMEEEDKEDQAMKWEIWMWMEDGRRMDISRVHMNMIRIRS